jgi:MFS transporter, MHS family, alpha-ketoglutarate permease
MPANNSPNVDGGPPRAGTMQSDGIGHRIAPPEQQRRVIIAGGAGNVIEWFDWTVYALFAVYFTQAFFPSTDPLASLLATFSIFAVGFLARPAGSVVLGRIAERNGRKAALSASVLLMAAASIGIALLPTHAQIGASAAVLLTLLRLVQGLSLGGETAAVGAYLVESAPDVRRGRFGSVYPATIMIGSLLGSLTGLVLNLALSDAQMREWGWRVPFLIGGLLGIVGYFIRRGAHEPLDPEHGRDPAPIRRTFTEHTRSAVVVFVVVGAAGLSFFGLVAGFPALAKFYQVSDDEAFVANVLGLLLLAILVPVLGSLSDRIGRRPLGTAGMLGLAALVGPSVWLLSNDHAVLAQLLIVMPTAAMQAVLMVSMIERFPTRLRGSGFGIVWALGVALVGGTGPLISTWLQTQSLAWVFPWYVGAWCLAAGLLLLATRETAFGPLPRD